MDNKRGFETGRLNELLLDALTEGAKFSDVLERIYVGTGLATAILDMDGSVTLCAPMDAERLSPLLEAMRSRADGKMAGLLRGEVLTFLPGEAGEGAALCRLVPAGGEPRHILALSLPLGTQASQGEKALDRISQLYAYYINGSGVEPQRHRTSYLESGLARELILGDRDIANSVFGNLYDLRFGGSSGVLEPGYVFAALGGAPVQELAEAEQALMRVLPNSFHLINNERLFVFISGVKREQYGQMLGRLAFFAENSSLRCGVSDVFGDLEERSGFRRQAEQALRLAEAPGSGGVCTAVEQYQPLMLAGALEQVGSRVLELSEVLSLADYDERNHTDYLTTLERYLAFGNRVSPAAAEMFIDRSTMKYRLQKIRSILGEDIDDPAVARRLEFGISIHRFGSNGCK